MFETTINEQRVRKFFKTKELAQEGVEKIYAEIAGNGQQLASLPTQLRSDALQGQQLLDTLDGSYTLLDAVKFFMNAHDMRSNSVTVREAWEGSATWVGQESSRYWQGYKSLCEQRVATNEGLKARSLKLTRTWIPRFVEDFGTYKICDVHSNMIEHWIDNLKTLAGRPMATETKKGGRIQLSAFFTHAGRMGWVKEDPIKGGKVRLRYDHQAQTKLPGIFSVEEVARLLEFAPAHLVPYIAIGAFCGIRPAELHRLDWSDIKWEGRKIHVSARKAKTAQQRDVTLPDNLLEWLAPYRQATGLIIDQSEKTTQGQLPKVRKAAGITKWPQDALRHSFASYHLALHRNSTLTSAEMGHMTPTLVWSKYNHHRTQEQGLAFFALRPEVPQNVLKVA